MTSPTEAEQISALATMLPADARAPWAALRKDAPQLEKDLLRLRLIQEARQRGATWARIGRVLGLGDKREAKVAVKRLARETNKALLRQQAG